MKTTIREVSITVDELRAATLVVVDALRDNEHMRAISNEHLPLVHAYLLGWVIRGVGIQSQSINPVLEFVRLGYEDFDDMKEQEAGSAE